MIALIALAANISATGLQPQLQPWSYLVGHCWTGAAPGGAGQDKHCFEPVFGGQHVRDRHAVISGGREVYAGETIYSVRRNKVTFTYWNSLGGVGVGDAAFRSGEWQFTGTIHATPDGAEQPLRASWRKVAAGYEVRESATDKPRLFKRAD